MGDGVHASHCCRRCGCKYGDDSDCAVMQNRVVQEYPCEMCEQHEADADMYADVIIARVAGWHDRESLRLAEAADKALAGSLREKECRRSSIFHKTTAVRLRCGDWKLPTTEPKPRKKLKVTLKGCHANRDGECSWDGCPQLRDNEPHRTGRHCPLDCNEDEP